MRVTSSNGAVLRSNMYSHSPTPMPSTSTLTTALVPTIVSSTPAEAMARRSVRLEMPSDTAVYTAATTAPATTTRTSSVATPSGPSGPWLWSTLAIIISNGGPSVATDSSRNTALTFDST